MLIGFSDLAYQTNVLLYKSDGFTVGKTLGIMIKIYVQIKLNITTGNQDYLRRASMTDFSDKLAF